MQSSRKPDEGVKADAPFGGGGRHSPARLAAPAARVQLNEGGVTTNPGHRALQPVSTFE
jgi:hypothetical protein